MAFDPSLGDATSRVRFDVGDFNDVVPIFAEAIYTALIARYDDSEARATIAAAEALIVKVGQDPDKVEVTGAVKVEWQNRIKGWRALANGLRADLGLPLQGEGVDNALRVGYFTRTTSAGSEFGG